MTNRRLRAKHDLDRERRQLVDLLKQVAAELSPDLSITRFCHAAGISSDRIYRVFGSWLDLRERAGLPREVQRTLTRHTRESLLAALAEVVEHYGEDVGLKDFTRHTSISPQPVYSLFGNWRLFREAAGLKKHRKPGLPPQFTEEQLRQKLREVVEQLGPTVTLRQFCEAIGTSPSVIYQQAGWTQLRKSLGLSRRGRRRTTPSMDAMLSNLFDLKQLLAAADHKTEWPD